MSKTIAEMVQRVGEDLLLVPIGQDLESQDSSRITDTYNEVYQRIKDAGYATWTSTGSVPTNVVGYVALMMAERLLITYNVPEIKANRIKIDAGPNGDTALLNLGRNITPDYESVDDDVDY